MLDYLGVVFKLLGNSKIVLLLLILELALQILHPLLLRMQRHLTLHALLFEVLVLLQKILHLGVELGEHHLVLGDYHVEVLLRLRVR